METWPWREVTRFWRDLTAARVIDRTDQGASSR
jgi:hypothetical protein